MRCLKKFYCAKRIIHWGVTSESLIVQRESLIGEMLQKVILHSKTRIILGELLKKFLLRKENHSLVRRVRKCYCATGIVHCV